MNNTYKFKLLYYCCLKFSLFAPPTWKNPGIRTAADIGFWALARRTCQNLRTSCMNTRLRCSRRQQEAFEPWLRLDTWHQQIWSKFAIYSKQPVWIYIQCSGVEIAKCCENTPKISSPPPGYKILITAFHFSPCLLLPPLSRMSS